MHMGFSIIYGQTSVTLCAEGEGKAKDEGKGKAKGEGEMTKGRERM
jgi:hypothetical protein